MIVGALVLFVKSKFVDMLYSPYGLGHGTETLFYTDVTATRLRKIHQTIDTQ